MLMSSDVPARVMWIRKDGLSIVCSNNNNNNNNFFFFIKQNFIHRLKKIDYLQIQEYEILKYLPYVHSSCVRKRIVVKWLP